MEITEGIVYLSNKKKYDLFFILNYDFNNYFKLFWQSNSIFDIYSLIYENYYKNYMFIHLFFFSKTYRNLGFLFFWSTTYIYFKLIYKKCLLFFKSKPLRFQRTRTNSITTQKYAGIGWSSLLKNLKFKRRTMESRKALAKKKNKPLKKSSSKLAKKKTKGPVKRSRDTKKSVWS